MSTARFLDITDPLVDSAATFAYAAHASRGQRRKYTGEPYFEHCARVAELVAQYGGDPETIAGAFLHDVVEDTSVTVEDLLAFFPEEVVKIVFECTEMPFSGKRADRKAKESVRLRTISARSQTVKYGDTSDNLTSVARHDPQFARIYLPEKRQALLSMDRGCSALRSHAFEALNSAVFSLGIHF